MLRLGDEVSRHPDLRRAVIKGRVQQDVRFLGFVPIEVLRIFYAAQVATHPPRFLFHCNDPDLVQSHYKRFLENVIRRHFDFTGVPLSLEFRPRREPDGAGE